MYDGSRLPYEENVSNTHEVVRVAHAAGVSVEAELGAVGGSAIEYGGTGTLESSLTDPDMVRDFVQSTDVDALAISVGNSHGPYKGEPDIRHDLIRQIRERVDIPLVMHGASGLPESEYARIIESGITKINYYSEMSIAAVAEQRAFVTTTDGSIGCHNVIRHMIGWYTKQTIRLLRLLGAPAESEAPCPSALVSSDTSETDESFAGIAGLSKAKIASIVANVLAEYRESEGQLN